MRHPEDRLRAVLFDLDGTLVDTADDFIPVVQQLRAEDALDPLEPERIRRSVSNGSRALVRLALGISEGDARFEPRRQRLLLPEVENRHVVWRRIQSRGLARRRPPRIPLKMLPQRKMAPTPNEPSRPSPRRAKRRLPSEAAKNKTKAPGNLPGAAIPRIA